MRITPRFIAASGSLAAVLLATAPAGAHINLTFPPRRGGALKQAPCGTAGSLRSATPMTLAPGASVIVTWDETIEHPGHFRISFLANGDNFQDPASFTDVVVPPVAPILMDNIADRVTDYPNGTGNASPHYSATVTLPNITCNNCTLQVIQVMTDKPPYTVGGDDVYHECADLILAGPTGSGGTGGSSATGIGGSGGGGPSGAGGSTVTGTAGTAGTGTAGTSGTGTAGTSGAGTGGSTSPTGAGGSTGTGGSGTASDAGTIPVGGASGGCIVAPSTAASWTAVMLLLVAFATRLRRRSR